MQFLSIFYFFFNRNIAMFETWHNNCLYGLGKEKVRIGTCDIPFQCSWLDSSIILEEPNENLTPYSITTCSLSASSEQTSHKHQTK